MTAKARSISVTVNGRQRNLLIVGFGEDTSGRTFLIGMDDDQIDYELWDDGVVEMILPNDNCIQGTFDPKEFALAIGDKT